MTTILQIRNDTTTNWTTLNPVLAVGEFGYDTVLKQHKIGDGVTAWNSSSFDTAGATGATGPAGPSGEVIINFGALPGSNEASVFVSDTNILSTSNCHAEFEADTTSDHTISDHNYASLLCSVTCSEPTAGVGFTIYATSLEKLSGTFNLVYFWS